MYVVGDWNSSLRIIIENSIEKQFWLLYVYAVCTSRIALLSDQEPFLFCVSQLGPLVTLDPGLLWLVERPDQLGQSAKTRQK